MSQLTKASQGQFVTHSPVGSDGMLSMCDSDKAMAEGPVGQYVTRSPVGSDGMFSMCDSDQPVAVGPVSPSVILGLVGPGRMLSQCKPDQAVADGPVGKSFTPGPVGPCGIVSKCTPNDPIADSPVDSTETPDPVDQKERPIQIDIMKIVTTDGSRTEGRPRIGIPTGRRVSDTRVPPNTEEDQVITFPWMDCLLNRESDESSSFGILNYDRDTRGNENVDFHSDREPTSDESSWEDYEAVSDISEIRSNEGGPVVPQTAFEYHVRNVAICCIENSSVGSGTDGRNSDIGDLADFSLDEEESQVEQISSCRIPGCQCEEGIEDMEWNYDDLSDSEDSEWEDPGQRSIRLSVERYNLDLFEGMTPMTYTPPPRKNRRKGYENNLKYTPEVQDSICCTSEMGFRTDEKLPSWNRHCNRRRMPRKISPHVGIRKKTMGPRSGPEVIRTFPV